MTVAELKEALDNFGDHLIVLSEFNTSDIFNINKVDTRTVGGELVVVIS